MSPLEKGAAVVNRGVDLQQAYREGKGIVGVTRLFPDLTGRDLITLANRAVSHTGMSGGVWTGLVKATVNGWCNEVGRSNQKLAERLRKELMVEFS